jgi:hypothetical protein
MGFPITFPYTFAGRTVEEYSSSQDFRMILQKPSGEKNKYYPSIISASVTTVYPYKVAIANVVVDTSAGSSTSAYLSPIRADDIVRVQVNARTMTNEPNIWIDIFEGRVIDKGGSINKNGKTITINCNGHGQALAYTYVPVDKTYTDKTTGYIVNDLMQYVGRFTDATPSQIDQATSTSLTSYTIKGNSKTIASIIAELEDLELNEFIFRVGTQYDSDRNLSLVYPIWEAISATATDKIAVREASNSFISADFSEGVTKMLNKVIVYGDGDPQYSGSAEDTDLQATYDIRVKPFVDKSLSSDAACAYVANSVLQRWKNPIITGNSVIMGTTLVKVGDRVPCRVPSIEVGGGIDDDYLVRGVTQTIGDKFTTRLVLGDVDVSVQGLITALILGNRLNNLNSIV